MATRETTPVSWEEADSMMVVQEAHDLVDLAF